MKKTALLFVLVLGGCISGPSAAQLAEIVSIRDAVKVEISTIGSIAVLNAPWSKVETSNILADVATVQKRVDRLAAKVEAAQ